MTFWLFGTRLGRIVLIALIILACWLGFRWYYLNEGKQRCQDAATAGFVKQETKGREVAQAADKAIAQTDTRVDREQAAAETKIEVVYRDRIKTVPVAAGSCVHPVDPDVQAELQRALQAANGGAP